ncbi:hypothetical protein L2E82_27942 [Cichorium intybus]|uniref:Uncharacterized protein n=1 Tax=Cichorium intybus TaxID=13427 RepID=A0ACB9CUK3_CICIN|nr:hypothetical protein L2E82_27942 [Cichorium intybus]
MVGRGLMRALMFDEISSVLGMFDEGYLVLNLLRFEGRGYYRVISKSFSRVSITQKDESSFLNSSEVRSSVCLFFFIDPLPFNRIHFECFLVYYSVSEVGFIIRHKRTKGWCLINC